MTDHKLTPEDKAELLGIMDADKHDEYDEEFFRLLKLQSPLDAEDIDDRIRRAILKYTSEFADRLLKTRPPEDLDLHDSIVTSLWVGLMVGYELGRKWPTAIQKREAL